MMEEYKFVYYDHYKFGNILDYIKNYMDDGEVYTILKYIDADNAEPKYIISGLFIEKFGGCDFSKLQNTWAIDMNEINKITSETDSIVLFDTIKIR